ncbi:glycosyltransferase family 4 protein [Faecalicatena contorta]|uniref:glycosyltransferase family 4 protein n=1 Tax=Faecalicatena contorta TaxID=39482 RepID=UPI001F209E37|nr:glycosyltransferase family 4 protein [Faecalicatena contorta]MCF2682179.1 glycosyltransferase family 4 protein [Faecalicatena contorta]
MKILITTDWYEPVINGVVTSVKILTSELRRSGHDVKILTLSRTCRSYVEDDVFYIGSVSVGKIYPEARFKLPVSEKYIQELLDWQPDIIHSQCEFSTFFLAKKIASELNIPIVHTYHTIYEDYTHYFSPRKKWGKEIVQIITKRLSGQVCGMIAPSEKIRKILEGYQVDCPLWVVPSGIHISQYEIEEADNWRERIRAKYSIGPETKVLLYVGRLAKEKNVEELISYQTEAREYGTVLMIVGDGPYRNTLEEHVKKLHLEDCVVFTGMVPQAEVGKYYQAGDLFVSASTSETQGMTYGEALASGLPLLCRRDDCLDGVIVEGNNGWQYENAEEFLTYLTGWEDKDEDEKHRMCQNAKESAGLFSAEGFCKKVEQIYEQKAKKRTERTDAA